MERSDIVHVAIVEDDPEIRAGFKLILNSSKGFYCNHTFIDAESAIKEIPNIYVNVVLMDIDLPGMTGIQAVRTLKEAHPHLEFMMLTVQRDASSVFDSLKAGAAGYILKDSEPTFIMSSIREVVQGGAPMSSEVAKMVISSFQKNVENPLTQREQEILKLMSEGSDYKTIAASIFISPETVKSHIKNIYSKLHVNSRGEAITKAFRKGLL